MPRITISLSEEANKNLELLKKKTSLKSSQVIQLFLVNADEILKNVDLLSIKQKV